MKKSIDLTGQKFGNLTVLKFAYMKKHKSYWRCLCDCGIEKVVRADKLKSGNTKSCGCIRHISNESRGWGKTRLYRIYRAMRSRCTDKNHKSYKDYGGRGIKICDEWLDNSLSFYNWAMTNGYDDTLSIDRIDNNGNYEPSNCRWAAIKEQNRNNSNCHYLTYNNETHCLAEWAEILGISINKIHSCLKKGIDVFNII